MANSCRLSTRKSKAYNACFQGIEERVFLSYMEDAKTFFGTNPENEKNPIKALFQIAIAAQVVRYADSLSNTNSPLTEDEKAKLAKELYNQLPLNLPTSNGVFEVSTAGNDLGRQFSAFNAKFSEDTTIKYTDSNGNEQTFVVKKGSSVELAYQQAKGYTSTKEGKGQRPKTGSMVAEATKALIEGGMEVGEATFLSVYLPIWEAWARQPEMQDSLKGSSINYN